MCTDEQWTQRPATQTLMISKFWISLFGKQKQQQQFNINTQFSYWLTPLDVPPGVEDYKFSFPQLSAVCGSHVPTKLK